MVCLPVLPAEQVPLACFAAILRHEKKKEKKRKTKKKQVPLASFAAILRHGQIVLNSFKKKLCF